LIYSVCSLLSYSVVVAKFTSGIVFNFHDYDTLQQFHCFNNSATSSQVTSTPLPTWSWSTEKRKKEKTDNNIIVELWDKVKWSNIHIIWIHKGVKGHRGKTETKHLKDIGWKTTRLDAKYKPTDPRRVTNTNLQKHKEDHTKSHYNHIPENQV